MSIDITKHLNKVSSWDKPSVDLWEADIFYTDVWDDTIYADGLERDFDTFRVVPDEFLGELSNVAGRTYYSDVRGNVIFTDDSINKDDCKVWSRTLTLTFVEEAGRATKMYDQVRIHILESTDKEAIIREMADYLEILGLGGLASFGLMDELPAFNYYGTSIGVSFIIFYAMMVASENK